MNRPLSSISLGLRVIPPSAGLARTVRRPVHRPAGHHIPTGRRYNLSVARDEELEKEIKHWRSKVEQISLVFVLDSFYFTPPVFNFLFQFFIPRYREVVSSPWYMVSSWPMNRPSYSPS